MRHRGELASLLNGARKAVEISEGAGSLKDVARLFPKENLIQLLKAEELLRVYMAPFLHGKRYSSFGRHFTTVEKLGKIVDRIHPYINSGDMVVDFCCGANDFSILLSKKLLSTGKHCHFKNFDIHPPPNDFYFEKGDWLINEGHDFLEGHKLIMGLNPPFGIRGSLASKFIRHALKFKPKLLVLIVPPETMRSSYEFRDYNYELVWEDKELLSGDASGLHAFYLPGSMDENYKENVPQWNKVPPPLYLWSSGDMIHKHREIGFLNRHIERLQADNGSRFPLERAPQQPLGPPLPTHRQGEGRSEGTNNRYYQDISAGTGGWLH